MPRVQNDETGRFETVYSDHDILDLLCREGITGTREVAEALGCSRTHAYRRLSELEEDGEITSRTIGGNRVWMSAQDGANA